MGWCNHPKRKTGSDVRVLVRAGQLPCRDDWDHDLWQQRIHGEGDDPADAVGHGPVQPATADQIEFLAAIDRRAKPTAPEQSPAAAEGIDVVVGETMSMREIGERPAGGGYDRLTVRRAHEQYRARKREQRSLLVPSFEQPDPSGDTAGEAPSAALDAWLQEPLDASPPPVVPPEDAIDPRAARSPVIDDLPRAGGLPVEPLDGDHRFSTVPEARVDVDLPFSAQLADQRPEPVPVEQVEQRGSLTTPRDRWRGAGAEAATGRNGVEPASRSGIGPMGDDEQAERRRFLLRSSELELDEDDAFDAVIPSPIIAPSAEAQRNGRASRHAAGAVAVDRDGLERATAVAAEIDDSEHVGQEPGIEPPGDGGARPAGGRDRDVGRCPPGLPNVPRLPTGRKR